jgi:membrane protease YdiL (CAAX protease family)
MPQPSITRRYPVATYLLLAYGIAWGAVLALVAPTGLPGRSDQIARLFPLVLLAMLAGPSLSGLLMTALLEGQAGLRALGARLVRWRIGRQWYLPLLIAPLLLASVLAVLTAIAPAFRPAILTSGDPLAVLLIAGVVGLAAGIGEEIGWTGFALPRLLVRWRPLTAGLALGSVWAFWHLLADYWGGVESFGVWYWPHFLQWVVALTAFRVLMAWVYAQTSSLLLAVLMHASFTSGQALLGPIGVTPAQGVLWYALFAAGLWLVVAAVVAAGGLGRPAGRAGVVAPAD